MDILFPCMVAPPFGNPKLPDHHVPNWLGYVLEFQEMSLTPKKKKWKEMGGTLLSGGPVPRFWAMIFVLYVSYCLSLVLTNRLSSTSLHPRFCWNSSLNLGHFHLAKLGNSDTVIHTHRQQSACIVACGFCFLCHMQMNKFPIWESISVFQPKS